MFSLARTMVFSLLALAVLPMSVSAAEDKAPPDDKLIEQLGSTDFAQRERAARMLQARGSAALPALRKAMKHPDAEVRRRVLAMLPSLELAAALAPKRVALGREPRTLSVILQEIEKQTGYRIDRDDKEDGRLYRVEMKEMLFWETVERLGRETGRGVDTSFGKDDLRLNLSETRSPFVSLRGPFRVELRRIHEDRDIDFTQAGKGKETGHRSHQLTLTLSILAEPRFIFLDAGRASVQTATDEDGKPLAPPAPDTQTGWTYNFVPAPKHFERTSGIILQRTSVKARKIKVLRGTIPVQVVVERKRIVFTENVLKAKGAKCRLREGILEITQVTRLKDGDLDLHIAVPLKPENIRWHNRVHLEDVKGHRYKDNSRGTITSAGQVEILLRYPASNDSKVGPPSKLIVEDWTILDCGIPFEFKDVPLP